MWVVVSPLTLSLQMWAHTHVNHVSNAIRVSIIAHMLPRFGCFFSIRTRALRSLTICGLWLLEAFPPIFKHISYVVYVIMKTINSQVFRSDAWQNVSRFKNKSNFLSILFGIMLQELSCYFNQQSFARRYTMKAYLQLFRQTAERRQAVKMPQFRSLPV